MILNPVLKPFQFLKYLFVVDIKGRMNVCSINGIKKYPWLKHYYERSNHQIYFFGLFIFDICNLIYEYSLKNMKLEI